MPAIQWRPKRGSLEPPKRPTGLTLDLPTYPNVGPPMVTIEDSRSIVMEPGARPRYAGSLTQTRADGKSLW